jgi:hypothetical protein
MKYRVAFMERTGADGERTEDPTRYVDLDDIDGVVLDQVFVERIEPEALHGSDSMEEDDDFESVATEVWEYDIAEGREQDFIDALKNSKMVMEYQAIDDVGISEPGQSIP